MPLQDSAVLNMERIRFAAARPLLTLFIREGKGGKDRLLPLGERAARWLMRYVNEVRPQLLIDINPTLFVND